MFSDSSLKATDPTKQVKEIPKPKTVNAKYPSIEIVVIQKP